MSRLLMLIIAVSLLHPSVAHASSEIDQLLQRSLAAYERIDNYQCTFHKKERVGGRIREERNMRLKFKKPASFYLQYTSGENAGLEAIYVEGKYDNKLEVHLGGFFDFFRIAVDPRGSQAMRNNRHPIMEAGIGHLLALIEKNYRQGRNDPDCRITREGETMLNGRAVHQVKATFPEGRGYYGGKILLFIDAESSLPVKIVVHGWNGEFLEEYQYDDIETNVGLTERDFAVDNPAYGY